MNTTVLALKHSVHMLCLAGTLLTMWNRAIFCYRISASRPKNVQNCDFCPSLHTVRRAAIY
jgi:hypothetical protein